jgi:Competence protein J (ComJ)
MPKIFETQTQILYTQFAIHRPEEGDFFETWTDDDVARGHQHRDGHVVYGVDDHDGLSTIAVWLEPVSSDGRKPLVIDVRADGLVLATLMVQFPFPVPAGRYLIHCRISPQLPEGLDIRITLTPDAKDPPWSENVP